MCAVDMQYVNVFVKRVYRKKEIKDKHNTAIEK